MGQRYSADLREKCISCYEQNNYTQLEVAELFGISLSTFKRSYNYYKATGKYEYPGSNAGRPRYLTDKDAAKLKQLVKKKPDILLEELQSHFVKHSGKLISLATICRALKRLNLRRKKISHYANEQHREDVKKKTRL